MKQLMNLTKVPVEYSDRVRAEASRRMERMKRRMKRFSDDLTRLYLIVQPIGPENKAWEARAVLKVASEVIACTGQSEDRPEAALKRAFDELERRSQRQLHTQRREVRERRKRGFQQSIRQIEDDVHQAVERGQHEVFELLLRSHLDKLRGVAHLLIEVNDVLGEQTFSGLSVAELIDETILRAWQQYPDRPADLPLDLWLVQILRKLAREEIDETSRFVPLSAALGDVDTTDQDYDPDLYSDHWWSQAETPVRLMWEDLIPEQDQPDGFDVQSYSEYRKSLLKALATLPQQEHDVITLHALEGYSFTEVAGILSLTEDEVSLSLAQGRTKLKTLLRPSME